MKTLILATEDDANWGYILSKILELQGYEVTGMKLRQHPFNYPKEMELTNLAEMNAATRHADLVIFPQFDLTIMNAIDLTGKKVGICHAGTFFRQNKKYCNEILNPLMTFQWVMGHDMWDPGTINKFYMGLGIDTDFITPDFTDYNITIKHSPSSNDRKGSPKIIQILERLKSKYPFITIDIRMDRCSWEENLRRVKPCDIYIDELMLYQGTQILGAYGMSALEAAAMGKIVVSNNLWAEHYRAEYGVYEMIQATNNEGEMFQRLERLILMTPDERLFLKQKTRAWVEAFHSLKSTGDRLIKKLEKYECVCSVADY